MVTKLTPKKNWTGNVRSTYVTLGASSHTDEERAVNDYYATDPKAARLLLGLETLSQDIWECACGEGHLSKVFEEAGYDVKSTDLVDRGFGVGGVNFLSKEILHWHGDIITNPPYRYAQAFVEKALSIIPHGKKVIFFLKLTFLESQRRRSLFLKNPPKVVYVTSSRLQCGKNGIFQGSSAAAYAWFVWVKGFQGEPVIRWFN